MGGDYGWSLVGGHGRTRALSVIAHVGSVLGFLRIELQTFRDYPFIEVLEALKMDELCVPEGANSERVTVSGPT